MKWNETNIEEEEIVFSKKNSKKAFAAQLIEKSKLIM